MVRIRPDGHLVFMGRYKDMLKVGGENVAPAEIEGRLLELDGVAEVAVVGYPDPRLGRGAGGLRGGGRRAPSSVADEVLGTCGAASPASRSPATCGWSTRCR